MSVPVRDVPTAFTRVRVGCGPGGAVLDSALVA